MVILPSIRRKYMVSRLPKGATVPMSDCVVTLAADSASYTGSARTVGVTVTWEGATLTVNTDYTLAYANNVSIGPATVTVTGMGQFSGSVTKTFQIVNGGASSWVGINLSGATLVSTTGGVSGGTRPFCVRGGYLYSGNTEAAVCRWQYDPEEKTFSNDNLYTRSNGYAGGFCVARNGLYSYMHIGYTGYQTVYMYAHSTAWDLSDTDNHYWDHGKGTPYSIPNKTGWSIGVIGVDIDTEGTRLFTLQESGYLHAHPLPTPFDVTSANKSNIVLADLYSIAGKENFKGMQIAPDGRRMVTITSDGVVNLWNFGTAWDVSTISLDSTQSLDTGITSVIYGIGISEDSSLLFIKFNGNPDMKVYDIS